MTSNDYLAPKRASTTEAGPHQLIPPEIADNLHASRILRLAAVAKILPQRSLLDPAVCHAVVALSAVHQDLERYGLPLPGQDLQNVWHRFALDQCGRSFALLSRRHASQDPRFHEVMLLCCLLFVSTQLLRGQYDDAFRHLRSGLRILKEAKGNPYEPPVEQCIVAAFTILEIQSLQYGGWEVVLENNGFEYQLCALDTPGVFSSFQDARQSLDSILGAAFRFLTRCDGLSDEEILLDYGELHQGQLELLAQYNEFGNSFELFCASRNFNAKEQRGADMMRLVQRSLALVVETCLLRDETALNYYTSEHEKHILMAEEIIAGSPIVLVSLLTLASSRPCTLQLCGAEITACGAEQLQSFNPGRIVRARLNPIGPLG